VLVRLWWLHACEALVASVNIVHMYNKLSVRHAMQHD